MDQITSFNNEAIQLFQTGQHQEAVQHLSGLLSQMKVILSSSSSSPQDEQNSSALLYVAEPLSALPPRCNFIYNKLFKVSTIKYDTTTTTTMSSESCHVFTACLIYNIAMIHHHLGLSTSTGKDNNNNTAAFLQKAESLYQMCIRILESFVTANPHLMMTVHLLKAVSYNNLAQLYMDRNGHEDEQVKNCLMNLHRFVTLMDEMKGNSNNNNHKVGSLFSEEDYDGIIDNILLLRSPTMAAAA